MRVAEDPDTMFDYYNTSAAFGRHDAAEFMRQVREDPGHWANPMAADLQAVLKDRHVLEVACGFGRWTRFAAEVAAHIVGTDYAPNNLAPAIAQGLPTEKAEFRLADAYAADGIAGDFDAGLHMNFFSHVPKSRAAEFLDALHRKLGSGAVVFMGSDQCGEHWMQRVYTKPASSDLITLRERPDGSKYEIINNVFNERTLCDIFEPLSTDLQIRIGKHWWWAWYTIR